MSVYLRILPGVKIRVGKRGRTRLSLGPRAARLHLGAGGDGVSTGAGPFTWYRPLRRRGKS